MVLKTHKNKLILFIVSTKINILDFRFLPSGHGHYFVEYTSPLTGKKFSTITNNMPLIDETKNAEQPKQKDLERLKYACKNL